MLRRPRLMVGLAVLFLVSLAPAQPPRGPGRGGFGGPGRGPGSLPQLLGLPEVRKELGTGDAQNKQVDDLLAELQEQLRASFGNVNFQDVQNLTPEEREKRFEEARKKAEQAGQKA